jgi:hypothetical protein
MTRRADALAERGRVAATRPAGGGACAGRRPGGLGLRRRATQRAAGPVPGPPRRAMARAGVDARAGAVSGRDRLPRHHRAGQTRGPRAAGRRPAGGHPPTRLASTRWSPTAGSTTAGRPPREEARWTVPWSVRCGEPWMPPGERAPYHHQAVSMGGVTRTKPEHASSAARQGATRRSSYPGHVRSGGWFHAYERIGAQEPPIARTDSVPETFTGG